MSCFIFILYIYLHYVNTKNLILIFSCNFISYKKIKPQNAVNLLPFIAIPLNFNRPIPHDLGVLKEDFKMGATE